MRPLDRLRDLMVVVIVVGLASSALLLPAVQARIGGLSADIGFWLRDRTFGPRHPDGSSPVVLVLIDEQTYAAFKGKPKDFWSPYFGTAISAITHAGARVIGFDIVLPISISPLLPGSGYDKTFWQALQLAGPAGKLVMASGQSGDTIVQPSREQLAFLGPGNVRSDTVLEDVDGVIRRQPLALRTAARTPGSEPGFAAEIARRAGWAPDRDGLLINFDGGQPFRTYSLADIVACAQDGAEEYFGREFKDRVVLIGTAVQFEDRLLTSRRFINPPERLTGEPCHAGSPPPAGSFARDTIPGVFVHAAVIDNLLRGEALRTVPQPARVFALLAVALFAALLGLRAGFVWGGICLTGLLVGLVAGMTLLMRNNIDGPLIEVAIAPVVSYFLLLGYRLVVTEHGRRRIRQMFGFYLAPSVVTRLEALGKLPERGVERRELTFFFSDIADFTSLTESADPMLLAPTLNGYFDGVCEAIEAEGGIVIEFLGDGVYAMFGAPAIQPDHAARGIAAARAVNVFTEQFRGTGAAKAMKFGHTRVGVHTGEALVGNIGASRRLKYAALGDVVNATSRLEGLNKYFGTRICVSEDTVNASADPDVRPIGDFLLKGKTRPVRVYELMAPGDGEQAWLKQYHEAYLRLSAGDPAASGLLEHLAAQYPEDRFIGFYLQRTRTGVLNTMIQMSDK